MHLINSDVVGNWEYKTAGIELTTLHTAWFPGPTVRAEGPSRTSMRLYVTWRATASWGSAGKTRPGTSRLRLASAQSGRREGQNLFCAGSCPLCEPALTTFVQSCSVLACAFGRPETPPSCPPVSCSVTLAAPCSCLLLHSKRRARCRQPLFEPSHHHLYNPHQSTPVVTRLMKAIVR